MIKVAISWKMLVFLVDVPALYDIFAKVLFEDFIIFITLSFSPMPNFPPHFVELLL